jgi:hypothetical protein
MSKDRLLSVTFHGAIRIKLIKGRSLTPTDPDHPDQKPIAYKEFKELKELVILKPAFWGISVDVKEIWRRWRKKWPSGCATPERRR